MFVVITEQNEFWNSRWSMY